MKKTYINKKEEMEADEKRRTKSKRERREIRKGREGGEERPKLENGLERMKKKRTGTLALSFPEVRANFTLGMTASQASFVT